MALLTCGEIAELRKICPDGIEQNINLAKVSRWRIGGIADLFIRPSSTDEVSALMQWTYSKGIRPIVIGLTTNLLFDDAGLRIPCIQIGPRMSNIEIYRDDVLVQAGIWVPKLAKKIMDAGLGGAEHICGIPGALGGLICMNSGSQRKSISSNIITVESIDPSGKLHTRDMKECGFDYRKSIFQSNNEVITQVKLHFEPKNRNAIRNEMLSILRDRRHKFPQRQPNCGSVFKSNPKMYEEIGPPGKVIEAAGLKAYIVGRAKVSEQHANFIVNTGGAAAMDVIKIIKIIYERVLLETGFELETEVKFLSEHGEILNPIELVDFE